MYSFYLAIHFPFQALIDEDRLLSRLEVLENQLHTYSKVSQIKGLKVLENQLHTYSKVSQIT